MPDDAGINGFARAYVALGANLGDRLATLRSAVHLLRESVVVDEVSRLYETAAVGPATGTFYNAVIGLRTQCGGDETLELLHSVERAHGRQRRIRWGDRTLDLDLLWHGSVNGDVHTLGVTTQAKLPHPEMTHRDFVLVPLCDLAPDLLVHGQTCRHWLQHIPADSRSLVAVVGESTWADDT